MPFRATAISLFLLVCMGAAWLNSQVPQSHSQPHGDYALNQITWVENKLQSMTADERIGQLFMVAAYSNKNADHEAQITNLIKQYNIGGLIFMQGTPEKQLALTSRFQAAAKVPLLIAMDAEWGLDMRLDNTPKFPRQLMLGAIQDNRLIYDMGREIARQCQRLGVHVNFAPVVDVNSNPNNPVINDRAFGEDKYNVAQKGVAYMRGMEENGVLACAKHFPGHGDTDTDSHHTLPVVSRSYGELFAQELYPFAEMIKYGTSGVMIAHLSVPALDDTPIKDGSGLTMPTTLSKKTVTDLLQKQMGFNGLVFTDALNMKGVSGQFPPGIVDVKALLAGNDVLLFSEDVPKAIGEIKKAIEAGEISQAEIDGRVRKILKAKYRVGLHSPAVPPITGVQGDLNSPDVELLNRRLIENALTIARDDRQMLPFTDLDKKRFASLAIGASTLTEFQATLSKYAPFRHHTLKTSDPESQYAKKVEELKGYSHVVVALHGMSRHASQNYGISDKTLTLIHNLQQYTNVVVTIFGNPYSLKFFNGSHAVLVAYEDNKLTQSLSAQLLFGAIAAKGKLPVSAGTYLAGQGKEARPLQRLKYTIPEESGFNSTDLQYIDAMAAESISKHETPGCQILVAKDGKVIFEKAYGYHTYNRRTPVRTSDLYDVASITKIVASVPCLMQMYELGKLNLNGPLSQLLPEVAGTNKANLKVSDILIHESGLRGWIPFYEATLPYNVRKSTYSSTPDGKYCLKVADGMYMCTDYEDVMWQAINDSDLPNRGEYKYSDLGYYYFKRAIETYTHQPLNKVVEQRFYNSLGVEMCYKPTEKYSKTSLVPTENDTKWRKQLVHGFVHDMGAAMQDGVGGHAGVFASANDLAIYMQMLLNEGYYGGKSYFRPETIDKFTATQKKGNRRGLGFDKPETNPAYANPASDKAPKSSFGHTGFTGTCVWADPDNNLIYVFLSNRVYPSMSNYKLVKNNTRTRIQDHVYEAMNRGRQTNTAPAIQRFTPRD